MHFSDSVGAMRAVEKKVNSVSVSDILKDLDRFLEDPEEGKVLKNYPAVFKQALEEYFRGT